MRFANESRDPRCPQFRAKGERQAFNRSELPQKIAIVHDWLTTFGGAERVLEQILTVIPQADLFTIVDFLPGDQRHFLGGRQPLTSFIQRLPFARQKYRSYLPLMPYAIEQFDLSSYEAVVSSSYAVAKGVITGPDQVHVSYVHSPIRYAWDLQHQYLQLAGLDKGIKSSATRYFLHQIRTWDVRTANGVDAFAANSDFVARRIWKCYRRKARVIHPPVDVSEFPLFEKKERFYVTASRLVPYKRIDLIVEAFRRMPDRLLFVLGDGPDLRRIKANASPNVTLLGHQPRQNLIEYIQRARAFIIAAEEDFGIAPLEAQACGTPVIAFGKGGVLETVKGLNSSGPTGVFFPEQTADSLVQAILKFEERIDAFLPARCRENAERYSPQSFRANFADFLAQEFGTDERERLSC